jgi:hypothetical protein
MLATGPKPSQEIEEAAEADGISRRTLFRAKKELGVKAKKEDGGWHWYPPQQQRKWSDNA